MGIKEPFDYARLNGDDRYYQSFFDCGSHFICVFVLKFKNQAGENLRRVLSKPDVCKKMV